MYWIILAIVFFAAMSSGVYMSFWVNVLSSGARYRKWNCWVIWGLSSKFTEDFLYHFPQGIESSNIPTSSENSFILLLSWQNRLLPLFLIWAIPTGMRWYLTNILIWISLLESVPEHIFMCLLAICSSSLEVSLLSLSLLFLIEFLLLLCVFIFSGY